MGDIGIAVQGHLPQTCEISECLCPTSPLLLSPFSTIPHCYPLTAEPRGLEYLRKRQELESFSLIISGNLMDSFS